jgi:outer membrane protein TolC
MICENLRETKTLKSMRHCISIITIILLNTSCFNGYSQDSLQFYLEIAAKNNPVVLQKYSEYEAALQKVPQVGSLPDPELNMGVFLSPMELPGGNQVADLRLMQMFPWFGVLRNAKDEMSLTANAKYESFRDAKLQVFYDVQRTWYELYKISQDIQLSEKNVQILQTIERLSIVKFQTASNIGGETSSSSISLGSTIQSQGTSAGSAGMQSMGGGSGTNANQPTSSMQSNSMGSASGGSGLADIYRVQIEIGDIESNIALLKNQQNTIVARFNSYLNRPVQSPVAIADTLKPDTLYFSLTAVSDSMLANNPMLGMLEYEQQSIAARKKMVTRMGYPMIGLGIDYSIINTSEMSTSAMNGRDMIMPMLSVTLPLYRKKYKAMQTEAGLMKTASEQNYTATANSLQTEYYEAIQLFQDAQRRIALYSNQYILAKKTLDIMLKSFATSGNELTDVLRIRQQTLDYKFKQVEAVVDYNTAIAWLNRLMAFTQI